MRYNWTTEGKWYTFPSGPAWSGNSACQRTMYAGNGWDTELMLYYLDRVVQQCSAPYGAPSFCGNTNTENAEIQRLYDESTYTKGGDWIGVLQFTFQSSRLYPYSSTGYSWVSIDPPTSPNPGWASSRYPESGKSAEYGTCGVVISCT